MKNPVSRVTDDEIEAARLVIGPRISRKNMRAALSAAAEVRSLSDSVSDGSKGVRLDGPELWEIVFGIMRGDVPEELTEDVLSQVAAAVNQSLALDSGTGGQQPVAFQERVGGWMRECFTPEVTADKLERNDRFIEEALELVQSLDYSADRAHALVDYVFGREKGEPSQEVGGVMVTLAALCNPNGLDMEGAAETELTRILDPAIILKIRAKQASKPTGSALPVPTEPKAGVVSEDMVDIAITTYCGTESNDMRDMMRAALAAVINGGKPTDGH